MSGKLTYDNNYTCRNKVKLVYGGSRFFSLLEQLINEAQHSIHLQTYVFSDDETGQLIAQALINAARRNVKVYVLADGYASQWLSRAFIYNLRKAGINFRFFEPLLRSKSFYFGRRMHYKGVVIDALYALVGGINIADRYNDLPGQQAWLDMALYVEGDAATKLYKLFYASWKKELVKDIPLPAYTNLALSTIPKSEYCSVRVRQNDFVNGRQDIWRTYFNLFNKAEKSITIMCSYFLPGLVLRKRLGLAAKRGVRIKVILAGPSDVLLAKYAERYLYRWMQRKGIEIYEYQPTVLHAKVAVADEHWATIGSFNVNNISAYASLELNLEVRNRPFAQMLQQELDKIIAKDCIQVTEKNYISNATLWMRFLQKSAYELIRFIFNLTTFYFKPR